MNVIDPETRKPRLLAEQCATCVGRPGNLMRLQDGRLKELIRSNTGPEALGLVCHETLEYGQHPEIGPSFCRWFYDRYGAQANYLRVCERLGGFTEVAP